MKKMLFGVEILILSPFMRLDEVKQKICGGLNFEAKTEFFTFSLTCGRSLLTVEDKYSLKVLRVSLKDLFEYYFIYVILFNHDLDHNIICILITNYKTMTFVKVKKCFKF